MSSTIETHYGTVEYAETGSGPPVLLVHGVLGGCDFALTAGGDFVPPGFRVISPSRFGYLASSMPPRPSPALQADAFAALLNRLGIDTVPVVAFSAGSSSAVQFALRHPRRISRLVLVSPNSPHPRPLRTPPRFLAPVIFSDPVFKAMRRFMRPTLERLAGVPKEFEADERERAAIDVILDSLFPVGPRAPGTIFDSYVGNPDIAGYRFERLTVPTLVIAAEDDTLAPYADTCAMAERIPGARLVSVPRGGHVLTHLDARATDAICRFLVPAPAPATLDLRVGAPQQPARMSAQVTGAPVSGSRSENWDR